MPDQPPPTAKIAPKVKNLEPERLLSGPRTTPLPQPRREAREIVGAALAKSLQERRP